MTDQKRGLEPILGWNDRRETQFAELRRQGFTPGRIVAANRELYQLRTEAGDFPARLSGRLRQALSERQEPQPVLGDWTAATLHSAMAIIRSVLPRTSFFSRKAAGHEIAEQVLAANIDLLFIVMGLDGDYNLNRLDRYLVLARHGQVRPVVVLTKADLCRDVAGYAARTSYQIGDVPVHAISNVTGSGVSELQQYLQRGTSFLFAGSSGAGKSTLTNLLVGKEVARTGTVSKGNGRGCATTTTGLIYETTSGALLIDSPGIREVQLWGDDDCLDAAFADIDDLQSQCRFRDCGHTGEPGCAVQQALLDGALTPERYQNYLKLKHELTETKESMLRKKRERFKSIAVAKRQMKRWHRD